MLIRVARRKRQNKGAIVPLVAICLIPFMFALAMAVDVGYMYVVQAELQTAADAAALAAAGEMSGASTDVYLEEATSAAKLYANQHTSLGMTGNLVVVDEDIEFGDASYDSSIGRWQFVPNAASEAPYAVRVTVRRNGDQNPSVPRFFSRVLGATQGSQSASAVAMIAPRDIALVVDLSQSMTFDSMLIHRNDTQINLRDVWVTLGGVANSPNTKWVDGQQFITHYELQSPGASIYASQTGPTFGSMTVWGAAIVQGAYNETEVAADAGMYYLPERSATPSGGWTETLGGTSDSRYTWLVTDTSNPTSLASRGHSAGEIAHLLNKPSSSETETKYRNRVKVLLGLATWTDSNNNDSMADSEVSTNVTEPYVQGEGWDTWIDDVRNANGLTYVDSWGGADYFRYRYGLKSYVNWLMDRQFAKDGTVSGSSGYTPALQRTVAEPLQALKDAVLEFTDYLKEVEANDKVGLVIYGTNGAEDPYSATNGLTNDYDVIADLPFPHQSGEHGRFTNTGEALLRGYKMIHGPGSRPYAHKVIVFMSDGNTTAYNGFDLIEDLDDPGSIAILQAVQDLDDFDDLFGGIPSGTITTGVNDSPTALSGRDETLAIGEILVSNHLGMGDVELNVVGCGADADMEHLLIPLAAANGGEAYYAEPDLSDPQALPNLLKEIYKKIGGRRPVALISQ